jgi:hypothetical protein
VKNICGATWLESLFEKAEFIEINEHFDCVAEVEHICDARAGKLIFKGTLIL